LNETLFGMIDKLCDKPLINMESAMNHPCQALADWRTLDEFKIPVRAKFVLSWAYHPKALPLAVPAATVHMAAMRGMEVVVLRPDGFALPEQVMEKARLAASAAGGSWKPIRACARTSRTGACASAGSSAPCPMRSSCTACPYAAMSRWPMRFSMVRAPW
jgi:ornithine carbamoyltransferase